MLCFLSCSSNVKINSGWVFWSCLWHFLVQARYTYSYLFDDLVHLYSTELADCQIIDKQGNSNDIENKKNKSDWDGLRLSTVKMDFMAEIGRSPMKKI